MVQVGVGTLLGIGVTVLLGMIVAIYKASANIATVSKNVSQMNDNLATKLDSLNRNISEMNGELRRISETTTRVETKFNGHSVNGRRSEASDHDPNYETDGAPSIAKSTIRDVPTGEFKLPEVGKITKISTNFSINGDGNEECHVEIAFPPELIVRTEKLKADLAALTRGLVGDPKGMTSRVKTTVVLPTSDPKAVEDWIHATVNLLDNEDYYEPFERVSIDVEDPSEDEVADNVADIASESADIKEALDEVLDSDSNPSEEDIPDDEDFTV